MWILAFFMMGVSVTALIFAQSAGEASTRSQNVEAGTFITYVQAATGYIAANGEPANGTSIALKFFPFPPGQNLDPETFQNIEYNDDFYLWGIPTYPGTVSEVAAWGGGNIGVVVNGKIVSPSSGYLGVAPAQAPEGSVIALIRADTACAGGCP